MSICFLKFYLSTPNISKYCFNLICFECEINIKEYELDKVFSPKEFIDVRTPRNGDDGLKCVRCQQVVGSNVRFVYHVLSN